MKHAQGRANWSGKPSLSHLWMGSTLHTLAMLVSIVVKFFQMALRRRARECHAEPTPERLPRTNNDPINRETTPADPLGQSQEGLMVSSEIAQSANSRPSNHEAALTSARHVLAQHGDCHRGRSPQGGEPGPIPQHSDSQINGSRTTLRVSGMTPLVCARFRQLQARLAT